MAFATILAVIAFFVAMVALWLASDIVKKVHSQNEQFVRSHIAGLRDELREMDKVIVKANRAAKQQENAQAGLEQRLDDHTKAMQMLKDQINGLTSHVEDLDRSIPSRYRVRIAKGEAKQAEKQASKPSIQ